MEMASYQSPLYKEVPSISSNIHNSRDKSSVADAMSLSSLPGDISSASSSATKAPLPSYNTARRSRNTGVLIQPSASSSSSATLGPGERHEEEFPTIDPEGRIFQLKLDEKLAGASTPERATRGMFKSVCSADVLFLIDTTSSMRRHIQSAKTQVLSILDDIEQTFFNEAEVRLAVVGYKDHHDTPNIEYLDFTSSGERVRNFIAGLQATGGADPAEDVLGGFKQALNASWQQQTRCIIHIADAPPHGRDLHDGCGDRYSEPGSAPGGLSHDTLFDQMVSLNINYALLRINRSTDKMAFTIFQKYIQAGGDCKLHGWNRYCSQSLQLSKSQIGGSGRGKQGVLLFEEARLGTSFSALRHLVVKAVASSASRTAVRMLTSTTKGAKKKLGTDLGTIGEDEDFSEPKKVDLELIAPEWETPGWLDETLVVGGFSPDVGFHGASTLNDMMAHDDKIKMSVTELTIHMRSRPFAKGALRVASYARTAASTNNFVAKSFKRGQKSLAHVAEDMRCQALCKAFALEFNALVGERKSLDFIVTTCLTGKRAGPSSNDECMSLEPYIEGYYVKYNNNCGFVNDDSTSYNKTAQAFSHFTFERSKGSLLVCDLQGVGRLLTDPAIHTRDPARFRLSETNFNEEGFKFFFATHDCNSICRKLELLSNRSMVASGSYTFRENWPGMKNTVCCSNKLCGKIVRISSARRSQTFPGYWCLACYLQLTSSAVRSICLAPDVLPHVFKVSKFFYESQGRMAPQFCPEHCIGDDIPTPRAAEIMEAESPPTINGSYGLWPRLMCGSKKKSTNFSKLFERKPST